MKLAEAKEFIKLHLQGDNSSAEISQLHIKQALIEICQHCEPSKLIDSYSADKTDVLRKLYNGLYIKYPQTPIDDEELPIDEDLSFAFIYFVCSYLSKKETKSGSYKDIYAQKAINVCSMHNTNKIEE